VSSANQALFLNAIPLLALTALYALATVALAPSLWRERSRLRNVEVGLALVFPCGAVTAAVLAGSVLAEGEPLGGNGWLTLPPILVALAPGVAFLGRWRDRGLMLAGSGFRRARDAEAQTIAGERPWESLNVFTTALARAETVDEIAGLALDEALALVEVDFAGLALVEGRAARGVLGRLRGGADVPLYSKVRFDLESEPSAVASATFEAAPIVIYDMATSPIVHRTVAEQIGAQSGAFVPIVSREQVIAVLAAVTTERKRTFSAEELSLLGDVAAESALALDRARSTSALVSALEREQLVASIARRVRSELDPDAVLRAAVEEVGRVIGCSRCLVRLGEPGERGAILAEWDAPGIEPIGAVGPELPVLEAAVLERRTAAIADVEEAPELRGPGSGTRQALLALGTQAALVTPIVVFDVGIGALALHDAARRAWSTDEIALAEAVAHELGIVFHTARLLRENERRIDQDAALLKAAQAVTSELEPSAVLQRLVDEVAQLLGGDGADCYLLDPERNVLRCAAVRGLTSELIGYEFPADRGLSGEALMRGRPVIAENYDRVAEPVPNTAYADFAHAIVAPIVWSGKPLGVLGVGSRPEGRAFDEADADVLEAFASLASLALRNAQAFEERSRQARIQRGFYRIASVLGESLSLAGTLDAVAQAASEALGGSFAAVLMRRGGRLELAGAQGLPDPLAHALEEGLPPTETALHTAAAEGRTLAAPAVADDERLEALGKELAGRSGYRSLLAIPLHRAEEHEEGGLVLVFFREERRFTDDDLELSRQLGRAVRGALERSSRFEEERRARSLAQQLARTGSLLASELDPAAVLDEVVQQAPALLEVDACAIRELDDEELVVTAAGGEGAEAALGERSPATGWLSGDVVQSRAPLAIEDAGGDDRLRSADTLLARGYRSFLGVPLAGPEGSTQGVLAVYARRPKAWRDEEIAALLALAGNASAALANAELYQRVALAKEQADAILSNIADGIVAVDREGKAVLWNNAAEQITGVPAAEALGRTPLQVLGRNLEAPGDERGNRLVPLRRGGDEVWLSLTEAIMRDPAGVVAGRIYAFRDISSDRMVEQMKSDFVSTVSQELRRPLTSIYGFAETLLRRDVAFGEDERRIFLGYIASESERLTEIVDRLLNVARLDTGDLQVNVVPTDVGSVVSEVVSGVEQLAADDHRFVLDVPDAPLHAEADPERLRQVVAHLIENAVKFSPEGGTVTVAARQRNGSVEVSVSDEGVGIPPGERERIFRKFYRGEAGGRGQLAGGTGLGLFIVQGLVQAMGGTISVDSTEGGGSSFAIALPLARQVAAQLATEAEAPRV
jgi:PAS domain S-box-containing protein